MEWFEIFSLVTGVIYLVLEIRQRSLMWIVGILTAAAAVVVFARQGLYASMLLNVYYVGVSVTGLMRWQRDERTVKADGEAETLHLRLLDRKILVFSTMLLFAGTPLLHLALLSAGDPASWMDAAVTVLSAIATWWLCLSIPQQWLLWIVADGASAWLCLSQGMHWMSVLYIVYAASAVYGFLHWQKNGKYIS